MKNTNTNNNKTEKETKTMKNTRKTRMARKISAALAAVMITTTAASIGASASNDRCGIIDIPIWTTAGVNINAKTADQIVKNGMKDMSYSKVLKTWQKVLSDPTEAFPGGCDINGDGEVSEEEKNEIADKVKEYAAGLTVGLMKMGLNACCDGLADCFEGPMGDFANALFDVPQEASNDDIMDKIDENTRLVLQKIDDSEDRIVNKTSDLNVASEFGKTMDRYESAANSHRQAIRTALNEDTNESKTVEIAYSLGNLGKWAEKNIVIKRDEARTVLTADHCTTDPEHFYNLYKIAFKTALNNGSLFMKEAVENSQKYVVNCTNKYLKSSITLLQMLDAMDEVSKFTPDQVAKLSESSRDNYNEIKNNAYKAASFKAQVLEDMLGEDGILAKTTAYVQRKVDQPTTYVGRGVEDDKHVKLRKDLDYFSNVHFIYPYYKRCFLYSEPYDWKWIAGSDTALMSVRGLGYKEVEGVCKHALKTGYTVENYLKANGFNIDTKGNNKRILATGHFDEYHGRNWKAYTSHEGFYGFNINKKYNSKADAEKWNLIRKHQLGLGASQCDEWKEGDDYIFMFFVKE